ncbi:hypothetical protein [Tuwongella immobilis]|uniref:DUF1871 domain-containing protein n=1 Tax=Tuwongella immobilis TaxID=692036 RepID=A0A6C2YUH2_9BACT|nr:hypothetical protein [Tuwongella immobilis]VIP04565.1 Uncharacterized protein OS=Haliangium ochraceum (strain DSM 14365 / JCM 11303 / SMP-2) GN=Hoch_0794 PE=4 SV=1 [Tuwongella immobilis]VTS06491.1 Uncharacterized protein OS=Haliangium ochraceum (strain DSM 14365 / JCM 11303 / SMP-2) GN=Hoch_0794 PE=4 SV=1 [Tuwongella immobilis]
MADLYEVVREAVHTKWDPIGIGESALELGEYDSYVSGLCNLLRSNPSEVEVFGYLWIVETDSLGLMGNRQATEQFAKWLRELVST